jgi:hypothetical protein
MNVKFDCVIECMPVHLEQRNARTLKSAWFHWPKSVDSPFRQRISFPARYQADRAAGALESLVCYTGKLAVGPDDLLEQAEHQQAQPQPMVWEKVGGLRLFRFPA